MAPMDLPSFDNSAMDGYAVCYADVAARLARTTRCTCRSSARSRPARPRLLRDDPGHRGQDHDRRPVPRAPTPSCRSSGPTPARDGAHHQAPLERPAHPAPGRGRATGDMLLDDGAVLGPRQIGLLASVGRAQVRARPRPRRGGHLHRLGAARARQQAGPRRDLRRQLLHARRRRALGRRDRLPGRASSPTTRGVRRRAERPAGPRRPGASPAAGSARATTTSSRRCSPASAPSGSARWRCSPASRRASASSARTAPRSSRCRATRSRSYVSFEVFVLPAHPQDDGPAALPPSAGPRRCCTAR